MMNAVVVKVVWLVVVLAFPLAIVVYYEKIKLGLIDLDPIKSKIQDTRKQI